MYTHKDSTSRVKDAFLSGLETFMYQAGYIPITEESDKMFLFLSEVQEFKIYLL